MGELLADRYELGELVGAGGVARVHRAVDRRLERDVAVKVLDDRQARAADPSGRDRFLREARSAARLHHPHLVTVYDAGEDDGELFMVMELVEGQTLAALIARRAPLPVDEAVAIAVQILDGLSAVHADGVIHRDIKPSNVLIDQAGRVRLTDFGIAKRLDDIEDSLTSAGTVVGTPSYLAPEQAAGRRLGVATDVFLVGLVLYEMLTGRRPEGPALDPRRVRSDVPASVAGVVARATAADPRQRYDSATAMIGALRSGGSATRTQTMARTAVATAPAVARADAHTAVMLGNPSPRGAANTTAIVPVVGPVEPERRMSAWWLLAAVAIVAALVVGVLVLADATPDQPEAPALTTQPATVVPAAQAATVPVTAVASAPPATAPVAPPGPGEGKVKPKGPGHEKKAHEDG